MILPDTEPSPEQRARIPEFVQKWTAIGLSTVPVDRDRAEWDLARFYEAAGLAEPWIVWLPCPMSALISAIAYTRIITAEHDQMLRPVRARIDYVEALTENLMPVNYSARRPVQLAIARALGTALRLRARSGGSIRDVTGARGPTLRIACRPTLSSPWDRVLLHELVVPIQQQLDPILGQLVRQAFRSVEWWIRDRASRSAAAAWLGLTQWLTSAAQSDYANQVLGCRIDRSFIDTMESCGPYWVLDGMCFVAERPLYIHRDEQGLLHCEVGPAIAYRSGWSCWLWHGAEVAQYVIDEPERITLSTIDTMRSPAFRRILIERYRHGAEIHGAGAFLRDAGAARLDHDERFGTLWWRDLDRDEPIVMLEVVNRTPEPDGSFKHYFLRVDPRLRPLLADGSFGKPQPLTARNAVASTFGLRGEQYAPDRET